MGIRVLWNDDDANAPDGVAMVHGGRVPVGQ